MLGWIQSAEEFVDNSLFVKRVILAHGNLEHLGLVLDVANINPALMSEQDRIEVPLGVDANVPLIILKKILKY